MPGVAFGDPDDPADPGEQMTAGSPEFVSALAQHLGLSGQTADSQRERGRQRLAHAGRPQARYRTWGEMMDRDPAVRQRAEQISETRQVHPAALQGDALAEFSNTYADGSNGGHELLHGEMAKYIAL